MINLSTQSVRPRTIIGTLPDPLHFSVVETKDRGGEWSGEGRGRGGGGGGGGGGGWGGGAGRGGETSQEVAA